MEKNIKVNGWPHHKIEETRQNKESENFKIEQEKLTNLNNRQKIRKFKKWTKPLESGSP